MSEIKIIDAEMRHYQDILQLNEEFVHFLAPMDIERLKWMAEMADRFIAVEADGKFAGFLIAMREGQAYDSENYRWFGAHYDKFLYIDRIVLTADCHRKGVGRKVYSELFRYAKECGVAVITAEIDIEPANPTSLSFHNALGFAEVGRQYVGGGKKQVSLQAAEV